MRIQIGNRFIAIERGFGLFERGVFRFGGRESGWTIYIFWLGISIGKTS